MRSRQSSPSRAASTEAPASTGAFTAAAVVAAASFLALVVSTYVQLPAFGPFPVLYEPVWYADKVVAAVAAAVALLAATAGTSRRLR